MDKDLLIIEIREKALRVIHPIKQVGENTRADPDFLLRADRTEAGRELPEYYFVFLLFNDILQFRNLGRFEKLAWSFPIDFNGEAFLIEYRKMGLGVFAKDAVVQNDDAGQIVSLIKRAVRIAKPYFELLANEAAAGSELNVANKCASLFERYSFFLSEYKRTLEADETTRTFGKSKNNIEEFFFRTRRNKNIDWLALAVIEAFFSWTEHLFIHIAILNRKISTGHEVGKIAADEWSGKFRLALPVSDQTNKKFFDKLISIRRQLRNYVSHGAFGKEGEAFSFHSPAGAVPVLINPKQIDSFGISDNLAFDDAEAIKVIEAFISHLWTGEREPAMIYAQKGGLPCILTMVQDGQYEAAMKSPEAMHKLLDYQHHLFDNAANMDW